MSGHDGCATVPRMSASVPPRPRCPECGEPIGAYEPVWRFGPRLGAELTSRLNLDGTWEPGDSLWHVACAEADGVEGG